MDTTKISTQESQNGQFGQALKNELSGVITIKSDESDQSVKFNETPWVVIPGTILIPGLAVAATFIAACVGVLFTFAQSEIAYDRQKSESADQALETKQKVLTDYGMVISNLVTQSNLGEEDDENVKNIARGQTLIALRRLNTNEVKSDSDNDTRNGMQKFLKGFQELLTGRNSLNSDESKDDEGELKGLLIRYLYDAKLIGYDPDVIPGDGDGEYVVDLYGADITKVVLEDAWLPGIDLAKAEYNEGNFKNTTLTKAQLYQANFTNADFTNADLMDANFTNANLTGANLYGARNLEPQQITQACHWQQAIYTPSKWDEQQQRWVVEDEAANQREIEKLSSELASELTDSAYCHKWDE